MVWVSSFFLQGVSKMKFPGLALAAMLGAIMVLPDPALSRTIDFGGGFRVQLPNVIRRNRSTAPTSSYSSHARWSTVVDGTVTFASNGQGIWIGYDEAGAMVMQIEPRIPRKEEQGTILPVRIDVNGRYYETVMTAVANEAMIVAHGPEVERILDRLMSGRTIAVDLGQERIETHLTGSSAAIREVRAEASIRRRMHAAGLLPPSTPEPETPDVVVDEEISGLAYYIPGLDGVGSAEVRFNIVEGSGLQLYVIFARIEGQSDPEHSISLNVDETKRMIGLIRKGEEWTEVAQANRVGLFSKRIGFVDDRLAQTGEEGEGSEAGTAIGARQEAQPPAGGGTVTNALTGEVQPRDFRGVNFNSYEDGSTSIQIEHSVGGFSRRFNMWLPNALELADSLESTLEYATFRLENRDMGKDEVDQLFQ